MTTYEAWSLVLEIVTVTFGLFMLGLGLRQLRGLLRQVKLGNEANRMSRLSALLAMEGSLAERRLTLGGASDAVTMASLDGDQAKFEAAKFEAAKRQFEEATQLYLNSIDRLCFCILKGYLDQDELRLEYRDFVHTTVKQFPNEFGCGTDYRNILKVHEMLMDG